MGDIVVEARGHIRIVTIHNETKRNAVNRAMEQALLDALLGADGDPDARVVVITGAGDVAFCSGHDLSEVAGPGKSISPDPMGTPGRMRKPVIAAVNGHCHAAGLMMALSCDIRVASENAVFGQPAVKLGQLPMGGQIWKLATLMSRSHGIEMMLTGDPLTAADAFKFGLVTHLVPAGRVLFEAMALAEKIARGSPASVMAIKEGLKRFQLDGVRDFDTFEQESFGRMKAGPDFVEGARAFMEKRPPRFVGSA
jgi:enoyl-CoA hydratase/carnithine racemase